MKRGDKVELESKITTATSKGIAKYFFLLIVFVIFYPNILNTLSWAWRFSGNNSNVFTSLGILAYLIFLVLTILYVFAVIESVIHIEPTFRGQRIEYMVMEKEERKEYMKKVLKNIGFFKNERLEPIIIGGIWLGGLSLFLCVSLGFKQFFSSFFTWWVPWRILIFSLTSLAEEIMFRYGLFRHMRVLMKKKFWPYVISSVIFAAMHLYSFGSTTVIEHVVGTFFLGLILAWIYESSDYSIYPSWIVHIIGDVIAFSA